jgi:hypothetical protein
MDPNRYTIIAYLPVEGSDDYKVVEYKVSDVVDNLDEFMKVLGAEKWEVKETSTLQQPPSPD